MTIDPPRLVLASRNPGKLREIRRELEGLDVEVLGIDEVAAQLPEPEETGPTFAANARDKARYYARATGCWCLADDSGLVVDALDGEPGVYSARYADDRVGPRAGREVLDPANNHKLLEQLESVPDPQRTARFVCHLCLAEGDEILIEARGTVEGRIARSPAGQNGFGYDPLFYLPETGCTTAQLSPEDKNAISHRGRAVRQFAEQLREMLHHRRA
jgi:XTP/dITP diphosphohydrolase